MAPKSIKTSELVEPPAKLIAIKTKTFKNKSKYETHTGLRGRPGPPA